MGGPHKVGPSQPGFAVRGECWHLSTPLRQRVQGRCGWKDCASLGSRPQGNYWGKEVHWMVECHFPFSLTLGHIFKSLCLCSFWHFWEFHTPTLETAPSQMCSLCALHGHSASWCAWSGCDLCTNGRFIPHCRLLQGYVITFSLRVRWSCDSLFWHFLQ